MTPTRYPDPVPTRQEWEELIVKVSGLAQSMDAVIVWQSSRDDRQTWMWRAVLGAFIASTVGGVGTLMVSVVGWVVVLYLTNGLASLATVIVK